MSRADINVSGASGSGTNVKIYETPEYGHSWRGACVMHGSFTAGPASPDNPRIEVVELCLPGLDIRVKADDVRAELRALLTANKNLQMADWGDEYQPARHEAFTALQAAVFSVAARSLTVGHLERIARDAYADGVRHGEEQMREKFRSLLGV